MAKGVPHYFRDGTKHSGGMHKMPNGDMHSGARHTKNSKKLFHFSELSDTAKKKARKKAWMSRCTFRRFTDAIVRLRKRKRLLRLKRLQKCNKKHRANVVVQNGRKRNDLSSLWSSKPKWLQRSLQGLQEASWCTAYNCGKKVTGSCGKVCKEGGR